MDKAKVYNTVDIATRDAEVAVYGLSRVNSVGYNRTDCPVDLIPTISAYLSGKIKIYSVPQLYYFHICNRN